jgi:NAD(P)-dependent dehydrogenase (short-subunit alcohol dehydrogenase family)
MASTIVVTGASSGIGKATAQYFHQKGWNVLATMRKPEAEQELKEDARLKLSRLDVVDIPSIQSSIDFAISTFGGIDVWLNNAGYGAFGPMEAGTDEQIRRQYDVNFFGVIDCMKAVLPHFKARKSGVIVNVTSIGGLLTLPLFGMYNSSKFALEGLTEGLWFDLAPFGIRVKLIEPGGIKTDFAGRSMDAWDITNFPEYKDYMAKMTARFTDPANTKNFGTPEMVAETIYNASTDGTDRLRYLVGKDAKLFAALRGWLGYRTQMKQVKKYFGL